MTDAVRTTCHDNRETVMENRDDMVEKHLRPDEHQESESPLSER